MPRANKQTDLLLKWFPVITVIISTIMASIVWTSWIARNVAQTSYVDELSNKQLKYIDLKIAEVTKYTDDKITTVRQETFAHSDINRSSMESEYKGLSAKLDMLIMMIQAKQAPVILDRK